MAGSLLIPIHVEALFLPGVKTLTEAAEDYTRLPYCNHRQDINLDIAFIIEEIVS